MLVSCFRFEKFEATISLKIFLFLLILSQFSSTWILKFGLLVLSQTSWRYWLYSIFFSFFYVCLSVLFAQLCSSSLILSSRACLLGMFSNVVFYLTSSFCGFKNFCLVCSICFQCFNFLAEFSFIFWTSQHTHFLSILETSC